MSGLANVAAVARREYMVRVTTRSYVFGTVVLLVGVLAIAFAPVIIRATVGGCVPLHPGPQHTQDFTLAFRSMVTFPVLDLTTPAEVQEAYQMAEQLDSPIMMVERRDLYDRT